MGGAASSVIRAIRTLSRLARASHWGLVRVMLGWRRAVVEEPAGLGCSGSPLKKQYLDTHVERKRFYSPDAQEKTHGMYVSPLNACVRCKRCCQAREDAKAETQVLPPGCDPRPARTSVYAMRKSA